MRVFTSVLLACTAHAGVTVWVADDLIRVRPNDAPGTAARAVVKAARNEWAPFQVVVNGGAGGVQGVNATLAPLRGKGGRITAITLYREHYVEVKTPSPFNKEGAGWYPDALIPFAKHRPDARFVAAPFDVPAGSNQPLWVDLFVPRNTVPGVYTGAVVINAKGQKTARVPVELTVWPFTLPDMPTLRTHFGRLREQWYGLAATDPKLKPVWEQFAAAMAAHKLSPPIPPYLYPKTNPDGSIEPAATHAELKQWMERYRVNSFDVRLQGKDPVAEPDRNIRHLRAMWDYLKENGWEKYAHVYVLDEPNTKEAYETVRKRAELIHKAQPGLKVLCTEQPTTQNPEWGNLYGAVDIWVPLWPLARDADVAARQAAGEEFWSYTALVQRTNTPTPFWQLDFPLLNYRVPAWIGWRYHNTGLLYWTTVYWDKAIDMWTDPLTFRKRYNMEGLLFYPAETVGMDGFLPSIRIKEIRESVEDYEYFVLAHDKTVAASLGRSWTDWETDPARYYAAREELARAIVSRK
ncbi:MAG: DUF4091 domain-containing protein [Acidobacteria bacterium]|nr:DUF4091 domain-containing protein [Acidobacteriota bacterium]